MKMKMEITTKLGLRYDPLVFKSEKRAESFIDHCVSRYWIILGDNSEYWVVCPRDFEKLIQGGYEAHK